MSSEAVEIWYDPERRFYAIPPGTSLLAGELRLRRVGGGQREVDPTVASIYEVPAEQARQHIAAHIDGAYADLRAAWRQLLAAGEGAARHQGVTLPEGALPDLPEDLESSLGISPGALYTDPEATRQRLREAMQQMAGASGQAKAAAEALGSGSTAPLRERLREVLARPEVASALEELGARLQEAGAKLREAAKERQSEDEST